MKEFVREILIEELPDFNAEEVDAFFADSLLLRYLDLKTGAIFGDSKTRRSFGNIYAIYSILHFYMDDYYNKASAYKEFEGYEFTKLFVFYRGLYGGKGLQNHALNSRLNGEFKNKFKSDEKYDGNLIIDNDGKYMLHINYLYINGIDVAKIAKKIIEKYINLLVSKDDKLISDIEELLSLCSNDSKKAKINQMLDEQSEARIF
ncbi:MAG: hypothetical protein FWF76_00620 [Oscillospiraceae bacterium]|nr:hypothetical protein [Oscillospiraceae bacterium]